MKQQVNFYSLQFKPKKELLSLENMLLVWLVAVVFVLVLYNFELERAEFAKKSWQMAEQRIQHQQRQLQELQAGFSARGDAVVLDKVLQDKQTSLQQRKYVLEQLGLRADGMSDGIAGLMENLATMSVAGLWLTEIRIDQGQLSLSGITNDVEKVPQLIQKIQKMSSLKDKRFARLEVKTLKDSEGLLTFTLQSEHPMVGQDETRRGSK